MERAIEVILRCTVLRETCTPASFLSFLSHIPPTSISLLFSPSLLSFSLPYSLLSVTPLPLFSPSLLSLSPLFSSFRNSSPLPLFSPSLLSFSLPYSLLSVTPLLSLSSLPLFSPSLYLSSLPLFSPSLLSFSLPYSLLFVSPLLSLSPILSSPSLLFSPLPLAVKDLGAYPFQCFTRKALMKP